MVHAESGRSKGSGTVLFANAQGARRSIGMPFHLRGVINSKSLLLILFFMYIRDIS
jgi:hypothetical protein